VSFRRCGQTRQHGCDAGGPAHNPEVGVSNPTATTKNHHRGRRTGQVGGLGVVGTVVNGRAPGWFQDRSLSTASSNCVKISHRGTSVRGRELADLTKPSPGSLRGRAEAAYERVLGHRDAHGVRNGEANRPQLQHDPGVEAHHALYSVRLRVVESHNISRTQVTEDVPFVVDFR
jgi:hypothetical protein